MTVRNCVKKEMRSGVRKRQNKKAGNVDVNSPWAMARLAFARQVLTQFTIRMSGRRSTRSESLQGDLGEGVQSILFVSSRLPFGARSMRSKSSALRNVKFNVGIIV